MNTDVSVAAPTLDDAAEQQLAEQVASLFAETERRFSRFCDDSELGHLNRAAGPITVSRELMELLCAAREHVNDTGGLFDPTIGEALCAAGYELGAADGARLLDGRPGIGGVLVASDATVRMVGELELADA